MKRFIAVILALAAVLSLSACGGSGAEEKEKTDAEETAEEAVEKADTDAIPLTVWAPKEDQTYLKKRIEEFKDTYSNDSFAVEIVAKEPDAAADAAAEDPDSAADVFVVGTERLPGLVSAGAVYDLTRVDAVLTAVTGKSLADIKEANGEGAVRAATSGGILYGFPYDCESLCLYYDPASISAEQAKTWTGLLDAAAAAGKKVGMVLASGDYVSSFFYGGGFSSALNEDGSTSINWNTTTDAGISGVQVVKVIQSIAAHGAFQPVLEGRLADVLAGGTLAAAVGSLADAEAAEKAFGKGYMACALPSFSIGETPLAARSTSTYRCMGVNPNAGNTGWAVVLAEFLTNEESQLAHFKATEAAPTNVNAAASDVLKSNMAVMGMAASGAVGTVQNVGENYWAPTAEFGKQLAHGSIAADDGAIQAALDALVVNVGAPVAAEAPEPAEE